MYRLFFICFCTFQINALPKNPSVLIVGAGAAGIAAATKLLENSITNITILEAENRIGGRVYTVKCDNNFVDLGAQFCHGEDGNVIYETVKNLGLLEHSFRDQTINIYYSNGSRLEQELAVDLFSTFQNYYYEEMNDTSGVSLGDALLSKYNATILKKYNTAEDKLKVATEGIKLIHDSIMMDEGASSWDHLSPGEHYQVCEGDQLLSWKTGGYHTILNILMKSHPSLNENDKIILNKTVEKIIWNGDNVKIETSDKTSLTADHVIFTPSIGVLKAQRNTLFEPQLPEKKQKAIEAIGFGRVIKIILHFPERWWNENDKTFFFLWSKEDLKNLKNEFSEGPQRDGIPWVSQMMQVLTQPGTPNVLIAFLIGDILPQVEEISDEMLKAGCMFTLKKFLGRSYNVTNVDKIISFRWISNPNFRGTFSYEKLEYFEDDVSYQKHLAEPLMGNRNTPVVLFAGEATHPTRYSTVHGAIESGRREAERIINLVKEN